MTEKSAGRVTRAHPTDGSQATALKIDEVVATEGAQDGLLGMALHPQLLRGTDNQYVYLAYTNDADPAPGSLDRRMKISRYTYDSETEKLSGPVDLITGLPASNDQEPCLLVRPPQRTGHRLRPRPAAVRERAWPQDRRRDSWSARPYWRTVNRYRDIAINPNNRTFYVATDASGLARNRWGRTTLELENPGSIVVFRYAPLG